MSACATWTADEDRELEAIMARRGGPDEIAAFAERIGRTVAAVEFRITHFGFGVLASAQEAVATQANEICDARYVAAMNEAIRLGAEHPHVGVITAPCTKNPRMVRTDPSLFSQTGSSAASCIDL